jgi:hypothetical protein
MNFGHLDATDQLRSVALALSTMSDQSDWWGSARIAFDAVIDSYRMRAEVLATEAQRGEW